MPIAIHEETSENTGHLRLASKADSSQSTDVVPSDSELQKLNEQELKAAIKSTWRKYERLARKEMGQLLFWLRKKLRAQGSRNDIHDKDRGFGAWVEENLDISRRTADRWAEWYAVEHGLREATSGQLTKSENDFFAGITCRTQRR
jgi:hypothetical protein